MPEEPWTVERVLRTPQKDILAAVKKGEGPPADVLQTLIERALRRDLRRTY